MLIFIRENLFLHQQINSITDLITSIEMERLSHPQNIPSAPKFHARCPINQQPKKTALLEGESSRYTKKEQSRHDYDNSPAVLATREFRQMTNPTTTDFKTQLPNHECQLPSREHFLGGGDAAGNRNNIFSISDQ